MVYTPPKYPGAIPTIEDLPNRQDDVDWLVAARYNELKKELRAALTELGTDPAGAYATVKARLDALSVFDKIIEGDTSVEVIDTNGDGRVDIKTENVLCGKYHSDGIHDLAKQSRCRVYFDAPDKIIPTETLTKIEWDLETYDNQNEFDPDTNHRFTAKKEGAYSIVCMLHYSIPIANKSFVIYVRKNAVEQAVGYIHSSNTDRIACLVTDIFYLAVNDFIEIFAYHYAGANQIVAANPKLSYLSIHKLS